MLRLLTSRLAALIALLVVLTSCKHDPVSPRPDTTPHAIGDTAHWKASLEYDSSRVKSGAVVPFSVTISPIPKQAYTVEWIFDHTIETHHVAGGLGFDTASFAVSGTGGHTVQVKCFDSLKALRCVTSGTIISYVNYNDTTSHDFVWKEYQLPTTYVSEDDATGCLVFGPNDIYVVNWYLYHFDGSTWTRAFLNNQAPGALSGSSLYGFSRDDFWIIHGSILYHWNGSTVEETRLEHTGVWQYPQDGVLHSAWGTSSHDMFFVGDSGTILHYDGTTWTKFPKVTSENLFTISGTTSNDVWTAGYNTSTAHSELLHFDGQSWSRDAFSTSGEAYNWGIGSVYACDSAGHKYAAIAGSAVFRRTNNTPWRRDTTVPNGDHIGISVYGNSPNDLFAVGDWGVVCHWNGRDWKRFDQFYAPSMPGYFPHQASVNGNTVAVVGLKQPSSWIIIGQRK